MKILSEGWVEYFHDVHVCLREAKTSKSTADLVMSSSLDSRSSPFLLTAPCGNT